MISLMVALNILTLLCIINGIRDFVIAIKCRVGWDAKFVALNDVRRDLIRLAKHSLILYAIWHGVQIPESVYLVVGLGLGFNSALDLVERKVLLYNKK